MSEPSPLRADHANLDRVLHAWQARLTAGLSPPAVAAAWGDWLVHLANAPGKRASLCDLALTDGVRLGLFARSLGSEEGPAPFVDMIDGRFSGEAWQRWPFQLWAQGFLAAERWWDAATTDVPGVGRQHLRAVNFMTKQALDLVSPANLPWANPEVWDRTLDEGGANLMRGRALWADDLGRLLNERPPAGTEVWRVGEDLAATPGAVIFRNDLVELIQYTPTTDDVRPEPVLLVPAWIMKYYILDLREENSLVRWLVGQGFTVFVLSWKNPGREDAHIGLDDYRRLGVMAALDVIADVLPDRQVHGCGYCLGGTLLAIAAAAMARDGDERFRSLTLLAAQTDFSEAGELMLFVDEGEIAFLEDMMWDQGFLASHQMAGAFRLLRANDLVWSQMIRQYLFGERTPVNDLMAWNADGTRMPARMQTEYLRDLFLDNRLSRARYAVDGRPVALADLDLPILAVGTERDHIAPWQSVYKIRLLTRAEVTFVLASGGHNAGVISEPGHPHRHHRVGALAADAAYLAPEAWAAGAATVDGSWWPTWAAWLHERSSPPVPPPALGASATGLPALAPAPGAYVHQR
ncbi:MAG: alpha/beta fold hydrolase [Pseudomonadota bacterium]